MPTRSHPIRSSSRSRGVSLIDVLTTIAVLAVVAAVAVPAVSDNHRLRMRGAAAILASDIEFAQTMTIAFPNDPVVMVFQPDSGSYHLALASNPNDPLTRPDTGEKYVTEFGAGRASAAMNVTFTVGGMSSNHIAFSPHGGLESFADVPWIRLQHSSSNTSALRVSIDPMTGTITETWQNSG
jgi:Tfp pilus assembly protein FimT